MARLTFPMAMILALAMVAAASFFENETAAAVVEYRIRGLEGTYGGQGVLAKGSIYEPIGHFSRIDRVSLRFDMEILDSGWYYFDFGDRVVDAVFPTRIFANLSTERELPVVPLAVSEIGGGSVGSGSRVFFWEVDLALPAWQMDGVESFRTTTPGPGEAGSFDWLLLSEIVAIDLKFNGLIATPGGIGDTVFDSEIRPSTISLNAVHLVIEGAVIPSPASAFALLIALGATCRFPRNSPHYAMPASGAIASHDGTPRLPLTRPIRPRRRPR